jgi:hypothetical protein
MEGQRRAPRIQKGWLEGTMGHPKAPALGLRWVCAEVGRRPRGPGNTPSR